MRLLNQRNSSCAGGSKLGGEDFVITEAGRLLAPQEKNGIEKSPKKSWKGTIPKCHLECQERRAIKRAVKKSRIIDGSVIGDGN